MQKYFMKQLLTKTNNCHAVRLVEKKKTIITNLLQCLQPNSRRLRTPATNFSYWTASCINFSQKAVDSEDKFLHTCLWWFLKIYISQGSVTTQLRCGGIFNNHFTANFLQNMRVKTFWKSVNIWRRYGQKFAAYFFGPPCILLVCQKVSNAQDTMLDWRTSATWGVAQVPQEVGLRSPHISI